RKARRLEVSTMRAFTIALVASWLVLTVFGGVARAQEKKSKTLQLKDLPPSVQKTVQDNLKGGAIKNIGKEKEDGIEQYEIETTVNGKARHFNVDVDGRLLVGEEATTMEGRHSEESGWRHGDDSRDVRETGAGAVVRSGLQGLEGQAPRDARHRGWQGSQGIAVHRAVFADAT